MANDLTGIVLNDFDYSDLENAEKGKALSKVFFEDDGKTIKAEFANNPKYKKLTDNLKNYPDFYGSTLDKWEIAGGYKNDKTGYYSTTFYNRESNELFVVDRGTNDPKDYLVDASMHIGNNISMLLQNI